MEEQLSCPFDCTFQCNATQPYRQRPEHTEPTTYPMDVTKLTVGSDPSVTIA